MKMQWKQVYIRLQNSQNRQKKDLHDFAGASLVRKDDPRGGKDALGNTST